MFLWVQYAGVRLVLPAQRMQALQRRVTAARRVQVPVLSPAPATPRLPQFSWQQCLSRGSVSGQVAGSAATFPFGFDVCQAAPVTCIRRLFFRLRVRVTQTNKCMVAESTARSLPLGM